MVDRDDVGVDLDVAVDLDQRHALGGGGDCGAALDGVDRADYDTVHAPGEKGFEAARLQRRGLVGITKEQSQTRLMKSVLHGFDHGWEKGGNYIGDDHPDSAGHFAAKRAGQRVDLVVELVGGGEDTTARFRPYWPGAAQGAGNACGRHAGSQGDVLYRG